MGLASQGVDRAELLVALVWVDVAGDELFARRTATITSPIQKGRCRITPHLIAALEQLLGQLHRLEIRPAHALIGGTAGTMRLQNDLHGLLQACLRFGCLAAASSEPADATGTPLGRRGCVGSSWPICFRSAIPR